MNFTIIMDLTILAGLVFVAWKSMKMVYDFMNQRISKSNPQDDNIEKIDDI